MIKEIFLQYLLQLLYTVGAVLIFGYLIARCNRWFYSNMGSMGMAACYVTGFIGTPVHELSHAFFCVIFGHKITDIQLFQIGSDDGTLGYVMHSYNPKNLYQRIGCFFIGLGPILVISCLLYLLALWLVPDMLLGVLGRVEMLGDDFEIKELFGTVGYVFKVLWANIRTKEFWIYLLVAMFLALHMTLSGADIKSVMGSFWILALVWLGVDVVLGLFGILDKFTLLIMKGASFLITFLALSLIISLAAVFLSAIIKFLRRKIRGW